MKNTHAKAHPKFRENIWRFSSDGEKAYLLTSDEAFEVDANEARAFLKIRSYCTGHNNITDISEKSGIEIAKVKSIIASLAEIGVIYPAIEPDDNNEAVNKKFLRICELWPEELKVNFIGNRLMHGRLSKDSIGWMVN